MPRTKKGALFVRCTDEEAATIRQGATLERRTVSGYILNAVISRIDAQDKLLREPANQPENPNRSPAQKPFLA